MGRPLPADRAAAHSGAALGRARGHDSELVVLKSSSARGLAQPLLRTESELQAMLFFLLRDHFRDLPERPHAGRRVLIYRGDARALLAAGLFLCGWCLLRLLARPGEGLSVDVALAITCLCLGVAAVRQGVRTLRR